MERPACRLNGETIATSDRLDSALNHALRHAFFSIVSPLRTLFKKRLIKYKCRLQMDSGTVASSP